MKTWFSLVRYPNSSKIEVQTEFTQIWFFRTHIKAKRSSCILVTNYTKHILKSAIMSTVAIFLYYNAAGSPHTTKTKNEKFRKLQTLINT